MARRYRKFDADDGVVTVVFGNDANQLRVVNLQRSLVAITVNSGTDPQVDQEDSDDDDTFFLSIDGLPSEFTEASPSGPWEVRMRCIEGQTARVELEEF